MSIEAWMAEQSQVAEVLDRVRRDHWAGRATGDLPADLEALHREAARLTIDFDRCRRRGDRTGMRRAATRLGGCTVALLLQLEDIPCSAPR